MSFDPRRRLRSTRIKLDTVTTGTVAEAVSVEQAREYLRIYGDEDDNEIRRLIKAATTFLEDITGRKFINSTYYQYWDDFPSNCGVSGDAWLEIRKLPVVSVNSITYTNSSGTAGTAWASSEWQSSINSPDTPGRIMPAFGNAWPTTQKSFDAVVVNYTSGYGTASSNLPDDVIYAITLLTKHWYDEREPVGSSNMVDMSLRSLITKISWDHP